MDQPEKVIVVRQPRLSELQLTRDLRYKVLDQDKGIARKTTSKTDDEAASIHMAAFVDGTIVCTVRLNPLEDAPTTYLVRRMATRPEYRGRGIGEEVLRAAELEAVRRGAHNFILHAREKAVKFYARVGYVATGEQVIHDGDVNITMTKKLKIGAV